MLHSKRMSVNRAEVNYDELARSTEDFNGAQLKAVCVEVSESISQWGEKQPSTCMVGSPQRK